MSLEDFGAEFIEALDLSKLDWEALNEHEAITEIYNDGLLYVIKANYKYVNEFECDYEITGVKIRQEFDQ